MNLRRGGRRSNQEAAESSTAALRAWLGATILAAWWARLTGRLRPQPCPYSLAAALEVPGRRLLAGPQRLLRDFDVRPGACVLEIGPGTGFYSVDLACRVGEQGRLVCLDIQPDMLRHTKQRVGAAGLETDCLHADARALPLRSSTVDRVLLVTVLGEIPDRHRAIAECRRVLVEDGRLCVSEQFPDPDFVSRRQLRRELVAAGFVEEKTSGWLLYTSTWSKRRLLAEVTGSRS
jgi:SAM-dependent methyltransferase